MTEELQTQGRKDDYDRTVLVNGLKRLKKIRDEEEKHLKKVKQDEEFLRVQKNKLNLKNRCCRNSRKPQRSKRKRGKYRMTRSGLNSKTESWDSTKRKVGQSRRKEVAAESKQRHTDQEPGNRLERFDDRAQEFGWSKDEDNPRAWVGKA